MQVRSLILLSFVLAVSQQQLQVLAKSAVHKFSRGKAFAVEFRPTTVVAQSKSLHDAW